MNSSADQKTSPATWAKRFILSILLGIFCYLLVVKVMFYPDIINVPAVAWKILQNFGHPMLKLKAYIAIFVLVLPFLIIFLWWIMPYFKENEDYG